MSTPSQPTHGDNEAALDGWAMIQRERQRQVDVEGYTPEHDAGHDGGDLAKAAAVYAFHAAEPNPSEPFPRLAAWPWRDEDFKPIDQRTCLVKAGALIAAEIDRLAALSASAEPESGEDRG